MTALHSLLYIRSSSCFLASDPGYGGVPSSRGWTLLRGQSCFSDITLSQWLTCRSSWVALGQRRHTGRVFGTGTAEGSGTSCAQYSWGRKQHSVQGTDGLNPHCLNCPSEGNSQQFQIISFTLSPILERGGPGTWGAQPVSEGGGCLPYLCLASTSCTLSCFHAR